MRTHTILTGIFASVALLYSQSTECLSVLETCANRPDSLKTLTVFEHQSGSVIKRAIRYDFSATSTTSEHVGPVPKVITSPSEFSRFFPKSNCSGTMGSLYCQTIRADSTLLFTRDLKNVLLFATSFKDIQGWDLQEINTSDTPGMRFDYLVSLSATPGYTYVTHKSRARLKLTGVNVGDEVTFVVTGHLTLCMCGGMCICFSDKINNCSLIDTTANARGYAVVRHIFSPEDQSTVEFSIIGAEHDMKAYISSLLIFKSGPIPTQTVVPPVALQHDDHTSLRSNGFNLNGQQIGKGMCSALKVVNRRTVVEVK